MVISIYLSSSINIACEICISHGIYYTAVQVLCVHESIIVHCEKIISNLGAAYKKIIIAITSIWNLILQSTEWSIGVIFPSINNNTFVTLSNFV